MALALALAAFGCGDNLHPVVDAPPGIPDADASTTTAVRLTLTVRGVPTAGARVVFQDASSGLILDTATAADGTASAVVPAGGYVTLVEPRPLPLGGPLAINDRLATFAAVEPGDDLRVDLSPPPPALSVTMSVPPDAPAISFDVTGSCGGGTIASAGGVVVPSELVLGSCGGTADFVVLGRDDLGTPVRAMFRPGIAVSAGAQIALPGPWSDLVTSTTSVGGVPAWVSGMYVEHGLASSRGLVFTTLATVDPLAASATFAVPAAPGLASTLRAALFPAPGGLSQQQVVVWGGPAVDPQIPDLGALALAPYTTAPVFDGPTRTVSWTEGTGATGDVVRVEIHGYRDGAPAHTWDWQLVAPHDGSTRVTYPRLPVVDVDFTPAAGDSSGVHELETLRVPGGYATVRAHGVRTRLDVVAPAAQGALAYQLLSPPQE